MKKVKLSKYHSGHILIEITGIRPEKILNLFWKNDIKVKNIKKKNITTIQLDINLKDYEKVEKICRQTGNKLKILRRKGLVFILFKIKARKSLLLGILIFICILYYLSTYIWGINIKSEQSVAPYEIRQQLRTMGIVPGINKKKINVYDIEEKLIKYNDDIMWAKVRMDGSKMKISVIERVAPPKVEVDNSPCNIIARKDGQIIRVFTSSGTPMVKTGDVVKKGQLLVKGEQGKKENSYEVHAKGCVIARTFYEREKEISIQQRKKERTGNKIENYYMIIKNKRIYLKNSLIKFDNYDKIGDNRFLIKKETYYEVVENKIKLDKQKLIDQAVEELYSNININLDKNVIVDKKVDVKLQDNNYLVRLVLIVEENIGVPEKVNDENY